MINNNNKTKKKIMTADGCAVHTAGFECNRETFICRNLLCIICLRCRRHRGRRPSERTHNPSDNNILILHRTTRYYRIVGDIIITII